MYLGAVIEVRDPQGQVHSFDSITASLDQALRSPGATATNVYMEEFAGGWLANGCPLNVYFGQGWLPGQQEALRAAGKTACLPAGSSPQINAILAPEYKPGGFTATGQRIIPGAGVEAPSAPVIVQAPGPLTDFMPQAPESHEAAAGFGNWGLLALAGLAIGFLAKRR